MCTSEKALEVRASRVRSESFALGKRFAVAKLTASLSPRAMLRPRLLVTSGGFSVTRDPSQHRQGSLDSSRPGRLGSKLIVAYPTPFLIITKIGCPFPLSLRRRKASLTVDRVQQGEASLFGSSSAQCQCGTLPLLVPIGVTLFTVDAMAARKKGDLVLYFDDLFPTEARKPPSCPLGKPKMDLYCWGISLIETSQR